MHAATLYWDLNGGTANSGTSATGTWDGTNLFWNTAFSGTGGTPQAGTTSADDLIFSSSTGYTAGGTITLSGPRVASSITFEENAAYTLSGGTSLTIGGTGAAAFDGIRVLAGNNAANSISTALILATGTNTIQTAGTGVLTISGGITGAQNLILQNNSTNAAGITISGTSLNNTGTLTNSGTGAGGTLISAVIGTNVTGVTQNSATSALTLSGVNTYSGTTTVTSGTLIGTSADRSFGTNLSGISIGGSGTLSLRNDSTVSFTNGTSAYNIGNSASGATINVDRVSGTGSNTITVGNLTTSSGAVTWQLNFSGANGVGLTAGTLTTPTAAAGSHTINNNISGGGILTLAGVTGGGTGASATLIFTGTGNTTVTGAITQAATAQALTKNGAGTLTLSGASSYTGLTTISAGDVKVQNNTSLGSAGTGTTVASGAAIQIDGSGLNVAEAITSLAGDGGGTGALRNLANNNTWSGAITIPGAARINSDFGTLTLSGGIGDSGGNDKTLTFGGAGNITVNSLIAAGSGAISVVKDGAGTLILSAGNTYTGSTTISAGDVKVQNNTSLGSAGTGTTVASGAAIQIDGSGLNVAEAITSLAGDGGGTGALQNLANNNTWSGAITIPDVGARINSDSGTLTLSGGIGETQGNAKTLTFGGAGNITVNSVIADGNDDINVVKDGTGTLTLSALNTNTGTTTINAGTVILDYTAAGDRLGTGDLTLGGGTLTLSGGANTENAHGNTIIAAGASSVTRSSGTSVLQMDAITRNVGGTVDFGAASIATTDTTNSGSTGILGPWATINGTDWASNSDSTDGPILAYTGYTNVTRLSSGTKAIPNTSTANVRIIEGTGSAADITLATTTTTINTLNQSASGGTSAATIDASGKTLAVNGILIGSGAGGLTIGTSVNSGTLKSAGTELIINSSSSNGSTINSTIVDGTGASTLTKVGSGKVTLTGTNTYTGGTTISGGTVAVGNNAALGTGTVKFQGGTGTLMSASSSGYTLANLVEIYQNTTIAGTGDLTLSGNFILKNNNYLLTIDNTAVTTFSGASITTDGNRTLTLNVNSASGGAVVSGAMQDSGANVLSVTKAGGGTLTLSGNNTYTGRTTVSGGTLLLAAANRIADTSPMTLSGGTFDTDGFSETVGALTLTANSVIDLGFSSGILRFSASNGLFTGGTSLSIYNWTSGSDHLFFGTNNSSLDGSQLGQISFYSGDTGGSFLGTATYTGTQGELVPIPEPSAVVGALGVLGLVGWRERRRLHRHFETTRSAIG